MSTQLKKVVVADKLSVEGLDALVAFEGLSVVVAEGKSRDELLGIMKDAEGLVVRSETQVDKELMEAAPMLKAVGRAGVGVDNIDIDEATSRGIVVMNAPDGNTIATAELSFVHMMNSFRPIARAVQTMRDGKWDKKNLKGVELRGKTLGVLGLGRIGAAVAKRALAFGMKVVAYDPYLSADRAQAMGVAKSTLEGVAAEADAITLHMPLTDQTKHIVGTEFLKGVKKGVRIVNCARGELIDTDALLKALDDGRVLSAGLDVFAVEPLPAEDKLRKHPGVCLTPHLGASTEEAQASVGVEIAQSVAGVVLHGQVRNALNAPSVSLEDLERLRPALQLAERLAVLVRALGPDEIDSLKLATKFSASDRVAISRSAMKGFLRKVSGSGVNDVNAPQILESRGIAFESTHTTAASDYNELLELTVVAKDCELTARGILMGTARLPRLVGLKGMSVELPLSASPLLVVENNDTPGVVGHVGTVLSQAGVNIANMTLGRKGDRALTMIELDEVPSAEVLEKLKASDAIVRADVVGF